MKGAVFSLARGVSLRSNSSGYYLYSEAPLRALKVNQALFARLEELTGRGARTTERAAMSGQLLRTLLGLISRGYLELAERPSLTLFPAVSVIVPVKDQPAELQECLDSLRALDYPRDRLEVIVIDDGSRERVSEQVHDPQAAILRLEESRGPAAARNLGVQNAHGEVMAFLDADCTANVDWLRSLLPFLEIERIGGVGGFVASYFDAGQLDRYEAVASSLNMGRRLLFQNEASANFYVPTCNFMVRREVFCQIGGFNDTLRVGEDVDFCWRMRSQDCDLLYLPFGAVAHKHRNQLSRMLKRRFTYGTSEAVLASLHPAKKKRFPLAIWAGLSFLSLAAAIVLPSQYPLAAIPLWLAADCIAKKIALKRRAFNPGWRAILASSLRSFFSLANFASFHLMRYYLSLLLVGGIFWHPIWLFCALALALSASVDYRVKKPRLNYLSFLWFFALEHLAYQWGVLAGCLRRRTFRSYFPHFGRTFSE